MKKTLLITILLLGMYSFGQDKEKTRIFKEAAKDFTKLSEEFQVCKSKNEIEDKKFDVLKAKLASNPTNGVIDSLQVQFAKGQKSTQKLDSIYTLFENYKKVYLNKGVSEDEIKKLFSHEYKISNSGLNTNKIKDSTKRPVDTKVKTELKTYQYYNDKLILKELKPTGNKEVDDILNAVLSKESKSYLGDIIIPKENQQFSFYSMVKVPRFRKDKSGQICKVIVKERLQPSETDFFRFKRVSFEILEGFFVDIKVIVSDESDSELLFENKIPVSILKYSSDAPDNFLFFKKFLKQNGIVKFDEKTKLRIRLSDVLMYVSKPGYNFIPSDITFDFPTKDKKGNSLNKDNPIKYEIKEDTSLQNVIELRAYTDFLALVAESPNGIVQLTGRGDFYMFPFLTIFDVDLRLFDKITPYVNFSRIDADMRGVETTGGAFSKATVNNGLDLLQKAYLEMGTRVNIINFKINKEMPFRVIGYFPARYQISDIKINNEFKNVQGLGLGGGVCLEFKRFNNFGFNYSLEYSRYSFIDFNSIPEFEPPRAFGVWRNEAEVFYYPGSNKKQSIFLRLKTYNNSSNSEAFYQLQFGYRFAIGISDVKAKTQ
jgi:hypothetical protein